MASRSCGRCFMTGPGRTIIIRLNRFKTIRQTGSLLHEKARSLFLCPEDDKHLDDRRELTYGQSSLGSI